MTDFDADRLLRDLKQRIAREDRLVTAYSGGADSALLAAVAHQVLGSRALAVTAVSASLPAAERAAARDFARSRGLAHVEVCTDELDRPAVPAQRRGPLLPLQERAVRRGRPGGGRDGRADRARHQPRRPV